MMKLVLVTLFSLSCLACSSHGPIKKHTKIVKTVVPTQVGTQFLYKTYKN